MVTLIDANARVGTVESKWIGSHGAEFENSNGELFHDFVAKQRQIVPSTWPQWHSGPHHTWTDNRRKKHRIDYIAVPSEWQQGEMHSEGNVEIDLANKKDDHKVISLSVELTFEQVHSERKARGIKYDKKS